MLSRLIELLLLLLVCLAPWAFGSVHPFALFLLLCGIAVALVLCAARLVCDPTATWRPSLADLSLAGIVLLGLLQSATLSPSYISKLSPEAARLYDRLLPDASDAERLFTCHTRRDREVARPVFPLRIGPRFDQRSHGVAPPGNLRCRERDFPVDCGLEPVLRRSPRYDLLDISNLRPGVWSVR